VGCDEAPALVRILLSQHAVEPDDAAFGPLETTIEQSAADSAAPEVGTHDVEPDERVPIAVERT